ncbi:MAG: hypothetical protein JST32_18515, partial [Bacteroidetes bacterium]|nr:hypothetical protein [Bacteroidota bacterium]
MSVTSRQAILISSPGGGNRPLTSDKDIRNLHNFMTSTRGGEWQNDEIILLDNPSWLPVKRLLDACTADYLFVYFGGHGWSDEYQRRYMSFRDFQVEDTALLNHTPKQLIISDSCRVYYPAISGISPGDDDYSGFAGGESRRAFDLAIANSRDGKIIVHATGHGDEAAEELFGRGGAFTLSLLYASLNYQTGMDLCP